MAAATDMATGAGARRSVIRSERFMQWQRELNNNRSLFGVFGPYDEKNEDIRTYQRKSDSGGGRKGNTSSKHEKFKENPEWQSDVTKAKGKEKLEQHEPKEPKEVLECKELETDVNADIHPKQKVSVSQPNLDLNGPKQEEVVQQQQQHQDEPSQLRAKRRRRVIITNEQVLEQPRRSTTCQVKDGMDLADTRASKRSSRILAKKLGTSVTKVSPPLPMKLPKLQVALNRKEIQDDWFQITGHKYTGKPKKSGLSQWGLGLCTSLSCPSSIRYLNAP